MCYVYVVVVIVVVILFYKFLVKPFKYWTNLDIPQEDILTIWKRHIKALFQVNPPAEGLRDLYNALPNHRYTGIYQFFQPFILLKDPDLIKQITIKDFDHFVNHRPMLPPDTEPLWSNNLIALRDEKWRDMRATVSPTFTSSKMKMMFGMICQCAQQLATYCENNDTSCVEMRDIFSRSTMDTIASIAFGLDCDSLQDPDNEFRRMGRKAIGFSSFKFMFIFLLPRISKFLEIKLFTKEVETFFNKLIKDTIQMREREGIVRPDILHLLTEARKGRLRPDEPAHEDDKFAPIGESNSEKVEIRQKPEITDEDITAQAFIFFLAGYDSSANTMCFMAYELAVQPQIQQRLQREIDDTLENCKGILTYEALMKMKYMDMVVLETLRKWPILSASDRVCQKAYTFNPVNEGEKPVHISEGQICILPIFGIQRDPRFFPEPDRFDPERFSDENKSNINKYTFLSFGVGPRGCIGNRFATLQVKTMFFYLLNKFNIVVIEKTTVPLKLSGHPFNLSSKDGYWLGLEARKSTTSGEI